MKNVLAPTLSVLCLTGMLSIPVPSAGATPARPGSSRDATVTHGSVHVLEGRVVAVRRASREVTIRTPQGTVRQVVIPNHVPVVARDAAGLNAIRSGGNVRLSVVEHSRGDLVAHSVTVR